MRWIFLALIFHCGGVSSVLADPFEDAAWAYEAGDYRVAVRLWRPLAQRGDARTQLAIGVMYREGHGVAVDPLRAYMWLNIGGANGNERAAELRDRLALHLTVAQVLKAQAMARDWAGAHPRGGVLARLGALSARADAGSQFKRGPCTTRARECCRILPRPGICTMLPPCGRMVRRNVVLVFSIAGPGAWRGTMPWPQTG